MGPPEIKNPSPAGTGEGSESSTLGKQLSSKNNTRTVDDYSRERFRLHSRIKAILTADAKERSPNKFVSNVHRTTACTWVRVSDVALIKPQKRTSYHYKGLATCGSVHACPICSSKIQERRRQEVAAAISYCATINRASFMVSYTFPHGLDQPLWLLLDLQRSAIKIMRESRGYKALMLRHHFAGRIRTLEVTHGKNGWHPHTHELLFLDPQTPAEPLREELASLWLKACTKVGLFREGHTVKSDFLRYSVDARAGDEGVAGYMAKMDDQSKWGLSHEMTKSSSKQGRRSGVHPFQLAQDSSTAHLFVQYAHAMKGQRQLVWSRGLKASVGIDEKTDEEIANEETSKVDDSIAITPDGWRVVVSNDARWELTHAAKTGGRVAVSEFLTLLGYQETPT